MTALNVYIGEDASWVLADGGCYDDDTHELVHLGTKVLPLCGIIGVLAWSGPAYLGYDLMKEAERAGAGDLWQCEKAVRPLLPSEPYSVLLVSPGLGLALQEGGRVNQMWPGDFAKSIPSAVEFDPDDIDGSGLAMMRDQRSSGVVYGFCLRTEVRCDSISQKILERW